MPTLLHISHGFNREFTLNEQPERLVIHGVREDGSFLRPEDWIERISSVLASFGSDHRLSYASSVKPCVIEGDKCLVVARCLEAANPQAYEFIMNFAKSNQLRIQMDRREGKRALGYQPASQA